MQMEEGPVLPVYTPLIMEERDRLTVILSDPVFIKAWRNAEAYRPSLFPGDPEKHEGQFGDNRAAKQLARVQGWELHKAALIKQGIEVVPRKKAPPEEYPASASLEAQVAKSLTKPK